MSAEINEYRVLLALWAALLGSVMACGKDAPPQQTMNAADASSAEPATEASDKPVVQDASAPKAAPGEAQPTADTPADVAPKAVAPTGPAADPAAVAARIPRLVKCNWKAATDACRADLKGMLEASDSATTDARLVSLRWLTQRSAMEAPGVVERLQRMVNRDPDQRVRRALCANVGRAGHPKLLAAAARYTISAHEPGLYTACFEGLVGFWADPSQPAPSADAYALTLKRLRALPRKAHQPPASVLNMLRRIPTGPAAKRTRQQAEWVKRTRSFYTPTQMTLAVQDVVEDANVAWQTRLAGIELLVHLKTPTSRLQAIADGLSAAEDPAARPLLVRLKRAIKGPSK